MRVPFARTIAAIALASAVSAAARAPVDAQTVAGANDLAAALVHYARFAAARPIGDGDRRAIAASTLDDLRRRPADAAIDRQVAALLQNVQHMADPEREAERTRVWNVFVARARAEGGALDPLTAAVMHANPVVANDPRTGISVSRHAFAGYASSVALTSRLAGRPELGALDMQRLLASMTAAFPSYPVEAQRDIADGAERWVALDRSIRSTSMGPLDALRARLASGADSPGDVEHLSQLLEDAVASDTFAEMTTETRAAFAAAFRAFTTRGAGFAP